MRSNSWSKQDENYLRENYGVVPVYEIAAKLERTYKAVTSRAKLLKIGNRRRFWSPDEKALFRKLYPNTEMDQLVKIFGRDAEAIYGAADRLGVKKSDEYQAKKKAAEAERLKNSGVANRFKPGHAPVNKGLRRPGWSAGRMRETQFKKGVRQGIAVKLYQPIGTERLTKDGYRQRKINDDLPLQKRWRGVHCIVWEEANGPIPKAHAVVFKDRNKLNCDLENLELVSRAELMRRNTLHNLPAPIKEAIHVLAGFRRKLNRYAEKQTDRSS
jgi:hypothetical protein